jgi:hypothetical protein
VDHPDQVSALQQYNETLGRSDVWNVFIKVDGGGRQVGRCLSTTISLMADGQAHHPSRIR